MPATDQEIIAARQLGEALLRFLVAWEEGGSKRRAQTPHVASNIASSIPTKEPTTDPQRGRRAEPEQLLLTLLESAKMLRVSDRHLRKMSYPNGPIPVVRIGNRLLYARKDIEAAIEVFRSNVNSATR